MTLPRRARDVSQPYRAPIIGALLLVVSIVILVAASIVYIVIGAFDFGLVASLGLIVANTVLSVVGLRLFALSRSLRAPAVDDLLKDDPRRPVVYLRSFNVDESAAVVVPNSEAQVAVPASTEEEHLAAVLGDLGPCIAIGRPGEPLATRGAARLYVSDAEWQASVTDWLARCQVVVLRPGMSAGLLWEFQLAVTALRPNQVVLAIAFGADEYGRFRERVDAWLPSPLPPHPGADRTVGTLQGVVLFDDGWAGAFRTFPKKRLPRSQLRAALQPILEQHRPGVTFAR